MYTMEGICAAILMLTTAYYVVGGTTLFSPGDTHASDLQLEQLVNDALEVLDTPQEYNYSVGYPEPGYDYYNATISPLEQMVGDIDRSPTVLNKNILIDSLHDLLINTTFTRGFTTKFNTSITYYRPDGSNVSVTTNTYHLNQNAVRATRLVRLPDKSVLIEVFTWHE
jgi:hypothetical protein